MVPFRTKNQLEEAWQLGRVQLVFLSVNYIVDVWINGHWAGYHEGGYTPFAFDVTELLRYDAPNAIVVRVDNPPWGSRDDIVPCVENTDWQNYAGIIQNVYLELLPAQHIVRADVRPLDLEGNLSLHVVLTNDSRDPQALTAEVKAYAAHVDDRTRTSSWVSEPLGARVSLEGETAQSAQLPARSARVLVGHLVRRPPFLDLGLSAPNGAFGASTGTAYSMATIPTPFAASSPLAAPDKRCRIPIPSASRCFKQLDNLVRRVRGLSS